MALPSTPPITLAQIQAEVGLGPGASLIDCLNASVLADKSLPVSMSRFLGYSHTPVPPASVGLTLIGFPSPTGFRVSWISGGGTVVQWRIEKQQGLEINPFSLVSVVGGSIFNVDDTDVISGNRYRYRVRAENSLGVSDWTYSSFEDFE